MGSQSDWVVMKKATETLRDLQVLYEVDIVSAHRTPEYMFTYAKTAKKRGLKVIIAGAGGAAHLPGMIASCVTLPVIGVPILSSNSLQGIDSLLSIVQMPTGVPVATVALNGAVNAAILASQILGIADSGVADRLENLKIKLQEKVSKQRDFLEEIDT